MDIPDDVIEKAVSALNIALALALRFDPAVHPAIMEAATKLDDAINAAEED